MPIRYERAAARVRSPAQLPGEITTGSRQTAPANGSGDGHELFLRSAIEHAYHRTVASMLVNFDNAFAIASTKVAMDKAAHKPGNTQERPPTPSPALIDRRVITAARPR